MDPAPSFLRWWFAVPTRSTPPTSNPSSTPLTVSSGGTVLEISLEVPWALLLLPLPYLVYRFAPPHRERTEAVRVPFFHVLSELAGVQPEEGAAIRNRHRLRLALLTAVWVLTVAALTRPVLYGEPVTVERSARDMLLAVDLSGSMDTRDLRDAAGREQRRIDVVKEVVSEFVSRREGDRLGLVVFGAAPYLQVPFTTDTRLVDTLLGESETGMAGDQTVLGDAVGLCLRVLSRSEASNRVIVLLTDGNDTGSVVPPVQSARIAARRGVTLHIVGVGDPRVAGEDGLNEDVLGQMASLTGGRYFHASDRTELASIYDELDGLEEITYESRTFTPERGVFHYPLGLAVLLMALFFAFLFARGMRRTKSRAQGAA